MAKRSISGSRFGRVLAGEAAPLLAMLGVAGAFVFGRLFRGSQRLRRWAESIIVTAPPRRPWWTRKRWIAAAVLWALLAYPLSVGPLSYAEGRGWLTTAPPTAVVIFYAPIRYALENRLPFSGLLRSYGNWCRTWGSQAQKAAR